MKRVNQPKRKNVLPVLQTYNRPASPSQDSTRPPPTAMVMPIIKYGVAFVVVLLQSLTSSAFISTGASFSRSSTSVIPPTTRRHANQKMADQSIKPADLSKAGLGGFDLISNTNKKFMEITSGSSAAPSTSPKKVIVPAKKSTVKMTNKSNVVPKKPMKKEMKVVATAASQGFKFPWDK